MKLRPSIFLVCALMVPVALVSRADMVEFSHRGVVHTVFLWLKQAGNDTHRHQLIRTTDRLRGIPGVRDIQFGEVIESDRDIVDDSFDVGIYFYFDNVDSMKAYLVHPLHRSIVETEIKPLVDRIVVHDFRDTVVN